MKSTKKRRKSQKKTNLGEFKKEESIENGRFWKAKKRTKTNE